MMDCLNQVVAIRSLTFPRQSRTGGAATTPSPVLVILPDPNENLKRNCMGATTDSDALWLPRMACRAPYSEVLLVMNA
jgi:hypothetical protein